MITQKPTKKECEAVRALFLFKGVDDALVSETLESGGCELGQYKRGDTIFSPESYKRSMGIVLAGAITVSKRHKDGRVLIMNAIGQGGCFGVAALFSSEEEYTTLITAARACRIFFLGQEPIKRLMQSSFTATENYMSFLTNRIRFLNDKIEDLTVGSSDKTVAKYIFDRMRPKNDQFVFNAAGSISEMAKTLNVGRASLYRAFDSLEGMGIIRKDGKQIVILEPDRLSDI